MCVGVSELDPCRPQASPSKPPCTPGQPPLLPQALQLGVSLSVTTLGLSSLGPSLAFHPPSQSVTKAWDRHELYVLLSVWLESLSSSRPPIQIPLVLTSWV